MVATGNMGRAVVTRGKFPVVVVSQPNVQHTCGIV